MRCSRQASSIKPLASILPPTCMHITAKCAGRRANFVLQLHHHRNFIFPLGECCCCCCYDHYRIYENRSDQMRQYDNHMKHKCDPQRFGLNIEVTTCLGQSSPIRTDKSLHNKSPAKRHKTSGEWKGRATLPIVGGTIETLLMRLGSNSSEGKKVGKAEILSLMRLESVQQPLQAIRWRWQK